MAAAYSATLAAASNGAAVIIDAEAAAGIDGLENDALALQLLDQFGDALDGFAERLHGANLRADVDADAVRLKPAVPCGALVNAERLADVDAELVLAQAGGDVGMRVGEDVGIDAQGKARDAFELAGAGGEQCQFGFALDVEFEMPALSARSISAAVLPTPEKTTRAAASGAAARTRSSSPPETMSKPAPRAASSLRMASAELAFTA